MPDCSRSPNGKDHWTWPPESIEELLIEVGVCHWCGEAVRVEDAPGRRTLTDADRRARS